MRGCRRLSASRTTTTCLLGAHLKVRGTLQHHKIRLQLFLLVHAMASSLALLPWMAEEGLYPHDIIPTRAPHLQSISSKCAIRRTTTSDCSPTPHWPGELSAGSIWTRTMRPPRGAGSTSFRVIWRGTTNPWPRYAPPLVGCHFC